MHAVTMFRLGSCATLAALGFLLKPGVARGTPTDPGPAAQNLSETERRLEANAPNDAHAYRDIPRLRAAPAAGSEFAWGTTYPSLRSPLFALQGRLGVSLETPSSATLVLAGQSGAMFGINSGSSDGTSGYLIRVPALFSPEVIWSDLISYRNLRFLNFHIGAAAGWAFVLGAQCQGGACNYAEPGAYPSFGGRVGLSYSAYERSSVGAFVAWQSDVITCPRQSGPTCEMLVHTLMWSLGWTLF